MPRQGPRTTTCSCWLVAAITAGCCVPAAAEPDLWFTGTDRNAIWRANRDGSGASVLYSNATPGANGPTAIDWDRATNSLVWGAGTNGGFYTGAANHDNGPSPTPAVRLLANPSPDDIALGVAVDRDSGRVFTTGRTSGVFTTDLGMGVTDFLARPIGLPATSAAFDRQTGRVFVGILNFGIVSIDPATGSTDVVTTAATGVRDLDVENGRVYWVEFDRLSVVNLDGSGREVLASTRGGNLRTLDVLGDSIYLGEFNNPDFEDLIYRVDLDGRNAVDLYGGDFGGIRGLVVVPAPGGILALGIGWFGALARTRCARGL